MLAQSWVKERAFRLESNVNRQSYQFNQANLLFTTLLPLDEHRNVCPVMRTNIQYLLHSLLNEASLRKHRHECQIMHSFGTLECGFRTWAVNR